MYVHLYVCPLNIWMHMLLYQLQGQPMEGVCSGGCRGCWGVEMLGRSLVPSCPIGLGASGSPKPLPGWAEPRSRKISQNPETFPGQEKPFPPCSNHRVAQLPAGGSHPCP